MPGLECKLKTYLYLMSPRALICALLCSFGIGLSAQSESPILIEKSFFSQRYYQYENRIKLSELIEKFEGNSEAHELIRKANNQNDLARFCQLSGLFLSLYPLFNEAIGRDPNYNMSLIGVGLVAVSIPLEISSRRKAEQAVAIYNKRLERKTEAHLLINNRGFGLSLRF